MKTLFKYLIVLPAVYIGGAYLLASGLCAPNASASPTPTPGPTNGALTGETIFWGIIAAVVAIISIILILNILLKLRSVRESAILELWDYAQRQPKGSHWRLWLENRIVLMSKRLGTKKRSARTIVNEIKGVQPKPRKKPVTITGIPANDHIEWKQAA